MRQSTLCAEPPPSLGPAMQRPRHPSNPHLAPDLRDSDDHPDLPADHNPSRAYAISAVRPDTRQEPIHSGESSTAKNSRPASPCSSTQDHPGDGSPISDSSECTSSPTRSTLSDPASSSSPAQGKHEVALDALPSALVAQPSGSLPSCSVEKAAEALSSVEQANGALISSLSPERKESNHESCSFASPASKQAGESTDAFDSNIALNPASTSVFSSIRTTTPPTPPKASVPSPRVAPSLVAGYDSNSDSGSGSESASDSGSGSDDAENANGGSTEIPNRSVNKNGIRPRKSLQKKNRKKARRRVRFAEKVDIRYIPTNRSNREREAAYMQQEFADFIDSMPISFDFSAGDGNYNSGLMGSNKSNEQGNAGADLFGFEEDLKAINSALLGPNNYYGKEKDDEDFLHLVDYEDESEEAQQQELEERVEALKKQLKRPREDFEDKQSDAFNHLKGNNNNNTSGGLDLEVLDILQTSRRNIKKRRVLTTTNNNKKKINEQEKTKKKQPNNNKNNNNNNKCGNASPLLNINRTTESDNDATVAN